MTQLNAQKMDALQVVVIGEPTSAFWQQLQNALQMIEISQFGLKVISSGEQDLTGLFHFLHKKKYDTLHIDAKQSSDSLNALVDALPFYGALVDFSLAGTGLSAAYSEKLLQALQKKVPQLKQLSVHHASLTCGQVADFISQSSLKILALLWVDLSTKTDEPGAFENMCLALKRGSLSKLVLSHPSLQENEMIILAEHLARMATPFHFHLDVPLALSDVGLVALLRALYLNPNIIITVHDILNNVMDLMIDELNRCCDENEALLKMQAEDPKQFGIALRKRLHLLTLRGLYQQHSSALYVIEVLLTAHFPTLQELVSHYVAKNANQLPIESLPIALVRELPPLTYAYSQELQQLYKVYDQVNSPEKAITIIDRIKKMAIQ
jgi:hypothetical protein